MKSITYTILNAAAANGAGSAILVEDYRFAVFSFATDGGGTAALTVKFQGAVNDGATDNQSPAFGSAQSVTNMWDYIQVVDYQTSTGIAGDTGVAVATADDYKLLKANTDGLKWINAIISGRTAGSVTVKVTLFN